MEIRDKVIEIISAQCEVQNLKEYLETNDDLSMLNLNSLSFIKMVLNFEIEFGIEFDDDALSFANFSSFKVLYDYIATLVTNEDSA